jgi:glycosyltransferase involved in cell wall biosynthesis
LFALPSEGEGFGIVFLEAMRAARPCLAAPGAAEEIVVDGVTGRVVARDVTALATALVELTSEPVRCDVLGRAGRQRLEQEFSSARFAARFIDAIQPTLTAC